MLFSLSKCPQSSAQNVVYSKENETVGFLFYVFCYIIEGTFAKSNNYSNTIINNYNIK